MFTGLTVMVTAPIMIVGGIIMAVREDGTLALLLLAILPLMALVIGITMSRAIPLFQAMQARIEPTESPESLRQWGERGPACILRGTHRLIPQAHGGMPPSEPREPRTLTVTPRASTRGLGSRRICGILLTCSTIRNGW